MSSLARWCVRHRFTVILLWVALFVGLTGASGSLGTNFRDTFNLPGTESTKALNLLVQGFGQTEKGDQDNIVFHATNGASLTDLATQAAIAAVPTRRRTNR
jgi:RND superfamily putative drug exporter